MTCGKNMPRENDNPMISYDLVEVDRFVFRQTRISGKILVAKLVAIPNNTQWQNAPKDPKSVSSELVPGLETRLLGTANHGCITLLVAGVSF